MKKFEYTELELEVIAFASEDVITTSPVKVTDGEGGSDDGDEFDNLVG